MIAENITLRSVEKTEIDSLQKISKSTFFETFVNDCLPEDMEKFLSDAFNFKILSSELENPESQFFFAEADQKIIGYLKINQGKAQTEQKLENALEIERLYVISDFHGKKVGHLLMNKALEIAKSEKFN